MNCGEMEKELVAFARGECGEGLRDSIEEHLKRCAACGKRLAAVGRAFAAAGTPPEVSHEFADAVMARIRAETAAGKPAPDSGYGWRWLLPILSAAALGMAGYHFYQALSAPATLPTATETAPPSSEEIPDYALTRDCLVAPCARGDR